jgi:hypothetical protein
VRAQRFCGIRHDRLTLTLQVGQRKIRLIDLSTCIHAIPHNVLRLSHKTLFASV